jgi:hypothetical protein
MPFGAFSPLVGQTARGQIELKLFQKKIRAVIQAKEASASSSQDFVREYTVS